MKKKVVSLAVSLALIVFVLTEIDFADILVRYRELSVQAVLLVFLALAGNLLVVSWRLHRILTHFGTLLPFWTAFRANVSGLVASLVMISLVGSVLGRQMVLRHAGVGAPVVAAISGYERILLTIVGGALFLAGALALIGAAGLSAMLADLPVVPMTLALVLAGGFTIALSRSPFELDLLRRLRARRNVYRMTEIVGITLAGQALVLSTYVVAITALGYAGGILPLLAAAAIVSFAASLPISVNGWGIREVASIFAFGFLDIPAADAVAASVLVGIGSTLLVLLAAPVLARRERPVAVPAAGGPQMPATTPGQPPDFQALDYQGLFAIVVALATAILLFFQFPVQIGETLVTVNLGDPLALLALGMVAAAGLAYRRLPFGLPGHFALWMAGLTLLLGLAFAIGAARFGITAWAVGNRGLGWLVILGYAACGALIVGQFGDHGRRRLVQAVTAAAVCVVVVHFGHRLALALDLTALRVPSNFEGFAANRNAFAFQLMVAAVMFQAYIVSLRRAGGVHVAILTVLYLGVIATGSITGLVTMGVAALLFLASPALRTRGPVALLAAIAIYKGGELAGPLLQAWTASLMQMAGDLLGYTVEETGRRRRSRLVSGIALSHASVAECWTSILDGLALWQSHPVFGAGLGAYMTEQVEDEGRPLVIHSTYVWIVAEMGLVGLLLAAWLPMWRAGNLWRRSRLRWQRGLPDLHRQDLAMAGLVLVFGVFSLTHEVAYQRIFWLLLGALMATPLARQKHVLSPPERAPTPRQDLRALPQPELLPSSTRRAL